ncbi:MAG: protein BatD [Myxococcales bacterium]|nr:protein BatD [Myxococcales bacterium]
MRASLPIATLLSLFALLFAPSSARAEKPIFKLAISPSEVSLGDTVTATVTIEIPGLVGPDRYWHPSAAEFKQIDSQIKRSTVTTIDPMVGQQLKTIEVYRYVLKPETTGRLAIGPAKMRYQGEDRETRERFVRVRANGFAGTKAVGIGHTDSEGLDAPGYLPPKGPRDDMFLYAVCDKSSAWVGEQFTVSWLLFTRAEVIRYEPTPPKLSALWSERLFEPREFFRYSDARIGEKDYVVALVSKRAFFATKPGRLTVAALRANIATVATAMGRGQSIASNEVSLEIRALPQPAPQGFDPSYVGEFRVGASVDRNLLRVGEALTLSVRVEGQGAMRRTRAPRLAFPGFKFDEPRDFQEEDTTSGNVVSGRRLYRYWTTPGKGGEQSIPAISLAYFSPSEGRYQFASTSAIGLTVEGDPTALRRASELELSAALDRDIRLLSTTEDVQSRVLVDFYRQRWFWYFLFSPPLAFLVVVVALRIRKRIQSETPRTRQRRARARAKEHFKIAAIHLRGERSAKFYGELSQALHAHLEVLLGKGTRSMRREPMSEFLGKRGVEKATLRKLLDSLDAFDREQFAPSSIEPEVMREALVTAEELLVAIDSQVRVDAVKTEGDPS